ncbi:MAG TPA: family 43 glycosylhydrolase, partial [Anaerolineales bacterium]|nr:family 43 glycosylhydrolase [Anaerolineales bacterium]
MTSISRFPLFLFLIMFAGVLFLQVPSPYGTAYGASPAQGKCSPLGWFPEGFGLKDHTVFKHDGFYYIASIFLPGEKKFAYGRSQDLCTWEDLGPILTERTPEDWDEMAIWAPDVLEVEGVYYMYYTGVTSNFTQSIMLATTTNPADPTSWEEQGLIFQPTHLGALWKAGYWSDCRDPHVIFANDQYYLFYTGTDVDGGIVGVASAPTPSGPWTDHGPVIPPTLGTIYESASAFVREGTYYLTYHAMINGASAGTFTLTSSTPDGLYTEPVHLAPGWAHEFWLDTENNWYTSYLTSYTVTIAP